MGDILQSQQHLLVSLPGKGFVSLYRTVSWFSRHARIDLGITVFHRIWQGILPCRFLTKLGTIQNWLFSPFQLPTKDEFVPEKSEIFECEVYLEEVADVICIAQAELPSLLPLDQVAVALLRVKYGPWLLCRLVANAPDSFEQGMYE